MSEPLQGKLFALPRNIRGEEAFTVWLKKEVGLSPRSAADLVSRVRRAMGFTDILAPESDHELVFRLQDTRGYRKCTPSVRSQIKRAARLYREFRQAEDGR